MGGTAASCLWLQPACHYDDSAAYQCRPQIYLSGTRLWPRLGLSLAPVHPSAFKVLLWHSGHNLSRYVQLHAATLQCYCSGCSFGEYDKIDAAQCLQTWRCASIMKICRARETLCHCWSTVTVFTSTREKAGKVYWDLSVLGGIVWVDNFADGAGEGCFKEAE